MTHRIEALTYNDTKATPSHLHADDGLTAETSPCSYKRLDGGEGMATDWPLCESISMSSAPALKRNKPISAKDASCGAYIREAILLKLFHPTLAYGFFWKQTNYPKLGTDFRQILLMASLNVNKTKTEEFTYPSNFTDRVELLKPDESHFFSPHQDLSLVTEDELSQINYLVLRLLADVALFNLVPSDTYDILVMRPIIEVVNAFIEYVSSVIKANAQYPFFYISNIQPNANGTTPTIDSL